MVIVHPIASGSKGNCYLLSDGKTSLLLECGISVKQMRHACNYNLNQTEACLITHEHQDHCRAVKDIMSAGIDCYLSRGTADALKVSGHHRCHILQARQVQSIGTWQVMPFETVHDAAEPLGFLLGSGDERVLFATDTAYIRNRFAGLTHVLVECNYDEQTLDGNVSAGTTPRSLADRIRQTHFGLENVLEFLNANDLSSVQGIWLLHLSDHNADAARIKQAVQRVTGKPVYICE